MKKFILLFNLCCLSYASFALATENPMNRLEQSGRPCNYGGQWYSSGTILNINGRPYKCVDGQWIPT
jgi:hypothetical protein